MSTFTEFESAVSDKRITYKQVVEALYESDPSLANQLFGQVAIAEDDPKVLRKKHRDTQVEKFGEDKEAIKTAMTEYDDTIRAKAPPGQAKPKPKPPVRLWSDEEKVYTKAKNAYVKSKEKEEGGDEVTLGEIKALRKKWRKEYDAEHKNKKDESSDEEPADEEPADEANEESDEFAYYKEDNSEDLERERQEDEREADLERERQEDEREADLEREDEELTVVKPPSKYKCTPDEKRFKALQKSKKNHTEEDQAEYESLKNKLKSQTKNLFP